MAIYLKIDKINGGATEKNHKEWIKLESLQFGVSRAVSMTVGHATSREAGQPSISEIHVTKPMDNASIDLFGWSVSKYDAKTLKIDIVSTGREDAYATYTLEKAVISGYSMSTGAEDHPHESISFSFIKIEEKFTPVGADQTAGKPVVKGYDIELGKAI
jgi:type VI secretion system secreted protein Hcp